MAIVADLDDARVISAQGSPSKPGKVQYGDLDWFGDPIGAFRWSR